MNTEIRQEQIAAAALRLIATDGLNKLSIAGVARRVGLVPSAIYRHFASKDQVIDTVLNHIETMLLANVQTVCQETPHPLNRLRRLLFRHIRTIRENKAIPQVVFAEDVYNGHPERKTRVYAMITKYLGQVGEIIRQGQQQGNIRTDCDAATLALLFLGLIQPSAILWHMSSGHFDVTKFAEKAWIIFNQAIQPQ